ncbi:ADP-ribosylglycohydrolase family protein [Corynebacterium heidelbergense]|uniref:ADP-ribosylglycohydrolase n=1 Tax=Corynebacterium heidelbergense TaxID=2055947 RepID=A0A364VAR4_9CORY|nr:ADP-ribosylglycohydrolase family protein [Corynebacterium heidelbergense]RAV33698.1 hypothetical protein CWC39_07155 [Corynebacterium heidelbergense]WCZ36228.1 ADP-ribosylglycohydrolase [Corynebacterium heidelbergense]
MDNRFASALFGTALGDAWGYPYQLPPQTERTPLPDELRISDDTLMTLALSTAIGAIADRDLSRKDGLLEIAQQFLDYHRDRDYNRYRGNATEEALQRMEERGIEEWHRCATHSGGSCAVMRLSPAGMLAPRRQRVGWSVLQGVITHDSGVARAACLVLGCLFSAEPGQDLTEVAGNIRLDPNLRADTVLTDHEKRGLLEDLRTAHVRRLRGEDVPLTVLIERVREVRRALSPILGDGDFERLYRERLKVKQTLGLGWDAGSCTASALLLAQLYLDHQERYDPHDFLHVAVNWPGNRKTRASLTGALMGAHMDNMESWKTARHYDFERRYHHAIYSGVWEGFAQA